MAHECIECGNDCYCGGDINDHHTGDDSECQGCGCNEEEDDEDGATADDDFIDDPEYWD